MLGAGFAVVLALLVTIFVCAFVDVFDLLDFLAADLEAAFAAFLAEILADLTLSDFLAADFAAVFATDFVFATDLAVVLVADRAAGFVAFFDAAVLRALGVLAFAPVEVDLAPAVLDFARVAAVEAAARDREACFFVDGIRGILL